uniref:Uncharacterized protein n=1 Tax=Rhizophora mucronata TaxID=61149 RepID=A0A2P2PVE0_RHIMU
MLCTGNNGDVSLGRTLQVSFHAMDVGRFLHYEAALRNFLPSLWIAKNNCLASF